MRIMLIAVLLLASGSAFAKPDLSFDIRFGNDTRQHEVRGPHVRKDQIKQRKLAKSRRHTIRHIVGNDHRHVRFYQHKPALKSVRRGSAGRWIRADQFQTRRHHVSDPVIHINARISALAMTGLKRDTNIHQAYVEFGNGSIVRLHEFQGGLYRGGRATRHFKQPRFVKRLILKVEPAHRHKRAYVGVDYLLVGRQ